MPTIFPANETLTNVVADLGTNENKSNNSKVVLIKDCHSTKSRNGNDKKKRIENEYVYDQELNSVPYLLSWF